MLLVPSSTLFDSPKPQRASRIFANQRVLAIRFRKTTALGEKGVSEMSPWDQESIFPVFRKINRSIDGKNRDSKTL
jgi:hypothetical protein